MAFDIREMTTVYFKKLIWYCFLMVAASSPALIVSCTVQNTPGSFLQGKVSMASLPGEADILIFSPHPDDESLAFAGVILQAHSEGKKVYLVTFTNGDGFALAAATAFCKPMAALQPSDMLELGRLRQIEELEAIALLGLNATEVSFLGYPDGGLRRVYETSDNSVYTHPATQMRETYGLHQSDYHSVAHGRPAAYNKLSVLSDITEIIQRVAPRQIYVTHPADTHPDHRAVFWFVRDALRALQSKGSLYTALVHAGAAAAWPLPHGATPGQPFEPPPLVLKTGEHPVSWPPAKHIPLDADQARIKLSSIQAHRSQLRLDIGVDFFESFVKREEIFWTVDCCKSRSPLD